MEHLPTCTDLPCVGLPDMFKLVHYEACAVGKLVVGILLECFLFCSMWSSTKTPPVLGSVKLSFTHSKIILLGFTWQPLFRNRKGLAMGINSWAISSDTNQSHSEWIEREVSTFIPGFSITSVQYCVICVTWITVYRWPDTIIRRDRRHPDHNRLIWLQWSVWNDRRGNTGNICYLLDCFLNLFCVGSS